MIASNSGARCSLAHRDPPGFALKTAPWRYLSLKSPADLPPASQGEFWSLNYPIQDEPGFHEWFKLASQILLRTSRLHHGLHAESCPMTMSTYLGHLLLVFRLLFTGSLGFSISRFMGLRGTVVTLSLVDCFKLASKMLRDASRLLTSCWKLLHERFLSLTPSAELPPAFQVEFWSSGNPFMGAIRHCTEPSFHDCFELASHMLLDFLPSFRSCSMTMSIFEIFCFSKRVLVPLGAMRGVFTLSLVSSMITLKSRAICSMARSVFEMFCWYSVYFLRGCLANVLRQLSDLPIVPFLWLRFAKFKDHSHPSSLLPPTASNSRARCSLVHWVLSASMLKLLHDDFFLWNLQVIFRLLFTSSFSRMSQLIGDFTYWV